MIIDAGNYTGKRGILKLHRYLKMLDTKSELILVFGNLKHDYGAPVRMRMYGDQLKNSGLGPAHQ